MSTIIETKIGTRTIGGTDWPVTDLLQRQKRRRSRPERWILTCALCNGTPQGAAEYSSLGEAVRAWWERGHDTPRLTGLPRITRHRTAADLTWLLEDLEIEHTVTPEGAIWCQLSEGRSLLLYQHCAADGADLEGLWAWRERDSDGQQCSGGLDTYVELRDLATAARRELLARLRDTSDRELYEEHAHPCSGEPIYSLTQRGWDLCERVGLSCDVDAYGMDYCVEYCVERDSAS